MPKREQPKYSVAGEPLLQRSWWKSSRYVWDYIAREVTMPFILSLTVIMFVFLLQFLMRFIDKIVGKGLGAWTIVELIAFNLAWMVVLAVPMAVLVACVMGFGSLSASNELTAMKAAGISFVRMLFPVLILGVGIAWFDLQFNNLVLPDANHKAKDLMSDIQRKKPTLSLEPGQFSDEDAIPGYSILARKVIPKSNELEEVTIYDQSDMNEAKVMTAKRGKIAFTPDFRNIILTLFDGEFHQYSLVQSSDYRRGHFSEYIVHVPANGFDFMRQGESERGGRELSAAALLKHVYHQDTAQAGFFAQLKQHLTSNALDLIRSTPAAGQYFETTPNPTPRPLIPGSTRAQPPNVASSIAANTKRVQKKNLAIAKSRDSLAAHARLRALAFTNRGIHAPQAPVGLQGQVPPKPQPVQPPDPLTRRRMLFQAKFAAIQTDIAQLNSVQDDIDSYMVEVHKKYAIPVACIVFVLIGAPLGALARRSGVGVGVGLSIGFFVLYWIFLIGGEKLADRGKLSPFWGMWGGNVLLTALGIYLVWRVAKGQQSGGASGAFFARLIPKRLRKTAVSEVSQ